MKISIITATWNSGATVQDTIDSVIAQMERCRALGVEVEHVIRDGGSKDDTVEIIRRNEPRYGGALRWVSERDGGIYDAMNKGIGMATGDVIGILNSDDFYTGDDVLVRVAEQFSSDPALEAVYGDIHFVKEPDLSRCTRYYSSKSFRPWMLRFGFMPAHPSFYVRRSVYEKYGLYDLDFRTSSDFEWMVRLFAKYRINARYLDMDFVTMREGGESTAGMEAKRRVNNDIVGSLRKHGIFTCGAFRYVRYAVKGVELLITKIKN